MCYRMMRRFYALLLTALMLSGCGDDAATPDASSTPPPDVSNPQSTVPSDDSDEAAVESVAPELSTEQAAFADKWTSASEAERRTMADLAKVYPVFLGATQTHIEKAIGKPTTAGVDAFGTDLMRYELGDVPEADGGGKYHLTFVFEDGKVVSLMGNSVTISP
jgi:hypothetical protein